VIPIQPPLHSRPPGADAGPECYDLRRLRSCNGSFLPSSFLRGHLYLNRSAVPRFATLASWNDVRAQVARAEASRQAAAEDDLLLMVLDGLEHELGSTGSRSPLTENALETIIRPRAPATATWRSALDKAASELPPELLTAAEGCVRQLGNQRHCASFLRSDTAPAPQHPAVAA
jgi:hypothetical protein